MLMSQVYMRAFNRPVAMHGGYAHAAMAGLGARILGGNIMIVAAEPPRPQAGTLDDRIGRAYDRANVRTYSIVDGVAVIPVEGVLVHKGGYIGQSCGVTSYEGLMAQVVRAASDQAVRGVVFEIDSGGGEVSGAFELAELIHRLSLAKPTMAILTDEAYSAAYLIASQCRQIVVPEQGGAGSIGVVCLHADFSAALEEAGVRVTILASGAHKADFNPYATLGEEVAARVRAELDDARRSFAAIVGRGRGRRLTAEAAWKTEAQVYAGREAVRLGLADAVGIPIDAFNTFAAALRR